MQPHPPDIRISRIDTLWTVVGQAHRSDGDVTDAQRQLLERYGGAARRYLLAATRDADVADELFQEFAVRFLQGKLRGASQDRGRFRDFLKGVLSKMVAERWRRIKPAAPLDSDLPEPKADTPTPEEDQLFLDGWRDELLAKSWSALEAAEKESGQPYFTVLRDRAEHPDESSAQIAERLGKVLGKPMNAASVRQTLHRARERFADFLINEIAEALDNPTPDAVEAELVALSLLEHCRPSLERRLGRE